MGRAGVRGVLRLGHRSTPLAGLAPTGAKCAMKFGAMISLARDRLSFHNSPQRCQRSLLVCVDIGNSFLYMGPSSCYNYDSLFVVIKQLYEYCIVLLRAFSYLSFSRLHIEAENLPFAEGKVVLSMADKEVYDFTVSNYAQNVLT